MKEMRVRIIIVFTLLLLTILSGNGHARVMVIECKSNADCAEDYICSEGICQNCLNCSLLFREGPSCVTDFKKCGRCLMGYEDFPITDFSTVIKPCELVANKVSSQQECLNDQHCPFGNYCHEKLCIRCFDCSLYNRLSPTGRCAREPEDCSSCLNGFYEVPVTTEKNTKPCQKIMSDSIEKVYLKQFFNSSSNIAIISLVCVELFIIVTIVLCRRNSGRGKQLSGIENLSPSPPPYSVNNPQNLRESEPEVEEESSFFTFVEEEKQQANTAKVFRMPQAPYYDAEEDDFEEFYGNSSEAEEEDVNDGSVNFRTQQGRVCSCSNCTEVDSGTVPPAREPAADVQGVSESNSNAAATSNLNLSGTVETEDSAIDAIIEQSTSRLDEGKSPSEEDQIDQ